jgi:hypothetical protein
VLRRVFNQHVQVVCFAVAGEQPAAHFVEDVQRVIRQAVLIQSSATRRPLESTSA